MSWDLAQADTAVKILDHARVRHPVHSGSWSEKFRVFCPGGSFAYAQTTIESAVVIDELTFSIWLRGDRPGLQLAARVVLPRSIDPKTGDALTLQIYGDSYRNVGRWQQVFLDRVMQKVRRQARVSQSGQPARIDVREAYVDRIMINLNGGPGETNVWIDDLTSQGFINGKTHAQTLVSDTHTDRIQSTSARRPQGSTEGPAVARIIEYQGEPFALLKDLRFNTLLLKQHPTKQQQHEADRHELWLLGPPSGAKNRSATKSSPDMRWLWYKPNGDQEPPITGPQKPRDIFSSFVSQPNETEIHTQIAQRAAEPLPLAEAFDDVLPQRIDLSYAEIRGQVLQKIAAGNQQFLFCSRTPLNDPNEANRRRCKAIELILIELDLLTPFLSAKATPQTIQSGRTAEGASFLKHEDFSLIIPTRQHVPGTWISKPREPLALTLPGLPITSRAFALNTFQFRPIERRRVAGGIQVKSSGLERNAFFLLTDDTQTIRQTARKVAKTKARSQDLFHWLVAEEVRLCRDTYQQLAQFQPTPNWSGSNSGLPVDRQTEQNPSLSHRQRYGQLNSDMKTYHTLMLSQWKLWQKACRGLGPPSRYPSLTRCDALPEAVAWDRLATTTSRGPNLLAKSLCSVAAARESGWQGIPELEWNGNLSIAEDPLDAVPIVHLRTNESDRISLMLESPTVFIPPGQCYAVEAEIRSRPLVAGSPQPLLIFDSSRGIGLAQRVGATTDWKKISFYRRSPLDGRITVSLAIQGAAEVSIRHLAVRRLIGDRSPEHPQPDFFLANPKNRKID